MISCKDKVIMESTAAVVSSPVQTSRKMLTALRIPKVHQLMKVKVNSKPSTPPVSPTPNRNKPQLEMGDFDCSLCHFLLYEPVTTGCGHTFCKSCILRAVNHRSQCPLCRTIIHITSGIGVNRLMQEVIEKAWPEEYSERKDEMTQSLKAITISEPTTENKDDDASPLVVMPLFVVDAVLFPNMKLPLHIFEPRYRLMLRRCLEGSRQFGLAPLIGSQIAKVGTVATIDQHAMLADGRSLVSITGTKRIKIVDSWDQDGYKMAKVQYLEDTTEPNDKLNALDPTPTLSKLSSMVAMRTSAIYIPVEMESGDKEKEAVKSLYEQTKTVVVDKIGKLLPSIQVKCGPMPQNDATVFSFWLASLLSAPVQRKQKLLEMQSVKERLEEELVILNESSS